MERVITNEDNKQKASDVGEVQVVDGYYLSEEYGSMERFISYYHQLDYIRRNNPKSVLVIGVGDDIIPGLLRKGVERVTTLDIDEALQPDVVADIRDMPLPDNSYDVVCAFQVLEHLPWEDQDKIMSEMARISRDVAIIGIPHRRVGFEMVFKFPFIRTLLKRHFLRVAFLVPTKFQGYEASGQHYWEIDWYTTKLSAVRAVFRKYFTIVEEQTPVLDPYRRFFYLKKN